MNFDQSKLTYWIPFICLHYLLKSQRFLENFMIDVIRFVSNKIIIFQINLGA